jgi:MoaA/NifB/PqqE/SkfB family radical SAM enzyme
MNGIINRVQSWKKGIPQGPFKLQFNPTDRCNLGCIFCWQRDTSRVSYENEVSTKRYIELVKEADGLGVKDVQITGGGEPFCRPKTTLRLMGELKKCKMRGSLITNGTLLKDKDIKNIVSIGWDEVIFSLDSPKSEIHDFLRNQKGSFDKTVNAIKRFNQYKNKPKLCIHFVLCNKNYNQLPELIELANNLNIKNVFIEPIVTVTETVDTGEKLKLTKKQLKELPKFAGKAFNLCRDYHIENNMERFLELKLTEKTNKMDKIIKESSKKSKGFNPLCFEPFYNLIIRPNGRVGPCCMFDYSGEYCHHKSLKDIWFGKHFTKVREKLLRKELMGYCSKCNPSQVVTNIKIREELRERGVFNKIKSFI